MKDKILKLEELRIQVYVEIYMFPDTYVLQNCNNNNNIIMGWVREGERKEKKKRGMDTNENPPDIYLKKYFQKRGKERIVKTQTIHT